MPDTSVNPGDEVPAGSEQSGENLCPRCGGSGVLDERPCPTCGGSGRVVELVGDA